MTRRLLTLMAFLCFASAAHSTTTIYPNATANTPTCAQTGPTTQTCYPAKQGFVTTTVAGLVAYQFTTPTVVMAKDGASSSDCSTGGGTTAVVCSWNGSSWTVLSGGGGGSGTVVASPQFAIPYYSTAGTSSSVTGVSPPTTNGNYVFGANVTGSAALQPTFIQPGLANRNFSGGTDTTLYSDNLNFVNFTGTTTTETLPTATTLGNSAFQSTFNTFGTGAFTLTPTTWALSLNANATTQTSVAIPNNQSCGVSVDTAGGLWDLNCVSLNGNRGVTTQTANYNASLLDQIIVCNSASAMSVALPTAGQTIGHIYTVKNINTGTCTVEPGTIASPSGTIDQLATFPITQWQALEVFFGGSTAYYIK